MPFIIVGGQLMGAVERAIGYNSHGQYAARITARVDVKLPLRHHAPIQVTRRLRRHVT